MKSFKPFDDAEFWSVLMSIVWAMITGGGTALLFIRKFITSWRNRPENEERLERKIKKLEKELRRLRREPDKLSDNDEPITGG